MKPQGTGQGQGLQAISQMCLKMCERALGGVSSLLWKVFKHRER